MIRVLTLDIMRVESTGGIHICNNNKAYARRAGMSLADDIVSQASAGEPRIHNGKVLYVPGEYPSTVLSIKLTFANNLWRCWYYGDMADTQKQEVLQWNKMSELEPFLRELISDLENNIITRILTKEAA